MSCSILLHLNIFQLLCVFRSNFNAPPAMPNWHPQPYSQWGNKEPAAPGVVHFASQPNHFPQQNAQDFGKHQKSETANVEVLLLY